MSEEKCSRERLCEDLAGMVLPYETEASEFLVTRRLTARALLHKQITPQDYTISGVVHKANSKDRAFVLNYCPFCVERIDWFRGHGTGK